MIEFSAILTQVLFFLAVILKWAGIVLAALVGIVIIISLFPIKIIIDYRERPFVQVRWLIFKKYLWRKRKKTGKKRAPPPTIEKIKKPKKEKLPSPPPTKEELLEYFTIFTKLWGKVIPSVQRILKRLTFAKIDFRMVVSTPDAAETAIAFGRANGVVHTALATMGSMFTLKIEHLTIDPDFLTGTTRASGYVELIIMPIVSLIWGAYIGFWVLKEYLSSRKRLKKQHKKEIKNGK